MANKIPASKAVQNGKIAISDAQLLDSIRAIAPKSYQQMVPSATQGSVSATLKALNSYTPNWDVFWHAFLGMFGRIVINDRFNFTSPLRKLKKSALTYGQNIEEIQVNLTRARVYDPSDSNVFGREGRNPDIHTAFHMQNRTDKYEINIPMQDVLRGGFTQDGQLTAFINACLAVPRETAENDEYEIMKELLSIYDSNEGFWNVKVPDFLGTTTHDEKQAAGADLAAAIRLVIKDFNYYSQASKFSPEGRKNGLRTRGIDPVVIIPNTVDAGLAPQVLAYAFNRSDATLTEDDGTIITIDRFPAELEAKGTQAIVLDRDWYQCADTLGPIEVSSPLNPSNLSYNYFYHIWQAISYSRFLPAVMLSTSESSEITDLTPTYTGVKLTDKAGGTTGKALGHEVVKLTAVVEGTNLPSQAVRFEVKTFNGKGNSYTLPADVFVDSTGSLHTGSAHEGDIIIVSATSLGDETKSAEYTLTVGE